MDPLMALVVGWTLVGAFVFTVVITCLSLVGWVRFADRKQQQKLFSALVVEVVLGLGGQLSDVARFAPGPVKQSVEADGANQVIGEVLEDALSRHTSPADPAVLHSLVDRMRVESSPRAAALQQELRAAIPARALSPSEVERVRTLTRPLRR